MRQPTQDVRRAWYHLSEKLRSTVIRELRSLSFEANNEDEAKVVTRAVTILLLGHGIGWNQLEKSSRDAFIASLKKRWGRKTTKVRLAALRLLEIQEETIGQSTLESSTRRDSHDSIVS